MSKRPRSVGRRTGRGVIGGAVQLILMLTLLFAALASVVWRQDQALRALEDIDELRRDRSAAEAEQAVLLRRIQALESRSRIVDEATRRLGLRLPTGTEILVVPFDEPRPGADRP